MLYRRFPMSVGGVALNATLPFQARSLSVDNPTSEYIKLGFDVPQFVPPYTLGAVYVINDTSVRAEFLAPTGLTNPPVIAGQSAVLIYYDLQMPPSAGVGIMGNRGPYYDRNSLSLTFAGSTRLTEGAGNSATLWTYTVPAGRMAYVEACKAITTIIQRYNSDVIAGTGLGTISTPVQVYVANSGIPTELVNARIVAGKTVGTDARDLIGTSMLLKAGDLLLTLGIDSRTLAGATGASLHEAEAKLTEFDA